jgi:hypothetical protein
MHAKRMHGERMMASVGVGHNSRSNRPKDVVSASKRGYKFQFSLTKLILQKLSRFRTVTAKKMNGDVVTRENFDQMGRDGGLDMVIEIEAKNRPAGLRTANSVKKALKSVGQ